MVFIIKIFSSLCKIIFQKISFLNLGTSPNPKSIIKLSWNSLVLQILNTSIIKAPLTLLIPPAKFLKSFILKIGVKNSLNQKPSL